MKKQIAAMVIDVPHGKERLLAFYENVMKGLRSKEKKDDSDHYRQAIAGLKACIQIKSSVPEAGEVAASLIPKVEAAYFARYPESRGH